MRGGQVRRGLLILAALTAACVASQESSCLLDRSGPTPVPSPSPTPTPTPVAVASPTPNPCDVKRVNAAAPTFVTLGETFRLDVTPVGPAGPQEGALDYCNALRSVKLESATAGVHCISGCSDFVQTWKADARGEAQIKVSVERVTSDPVIVTVR